MLSSICLMLFSISSFLPSGFWHLTEFAENDHFASFLDDFGRLLCLASRFCVSTIDEHTVMGQRVPRLLDAEGTKMLSFGDYLRLSVSLSWPIATLSSIFRFTPVTSGCCVLRHCMSVFTFLLDISASVWVDQCPPDSSKVPPKAVREYQTHGKTYLDISSFPKYEVRDW